MKLPSQKALNLIFEYEVGGGQAYYEKKLSRFTWPGGASGPTIGIGIDTGYYTSKELANIFNFLPEDQIKLIQGATGKTGSGAGKEYTNVLRQANIVVTWSHALDIFNQLTWSKFANAAEKAFPGLDQFEDDAYGALVSLVFNRGTAMQGDARKEMRAIRSLVPKKDYNGIAEQLIAMKRIWVGKDLDGLLRRRDAEAALVASCA
jgi:GH24 family phage-related lysozyme (muramidase)